MLGRVRENHPGRGGAFLGHHRRHQHQQSVAYPPGQRRRRRNHRHSVDLGPGQLSHQLPGQKTVGKAVRAVGRRLRQIRHEEERGVLVHSGPHEENHQYQSAKTSKLPGSDVNAPIRSIPSPGGR